MRALSRDELPDLRCRRPKAREPRGEHIDDGEMDDVNVVDDIVLLLSSLESSPLRTSIKHLPITTKLLALLDHVPNLPIPPNSRPRPLPPTTSPIDLDLTHPYLHPNETPQWDPNRPVNSGIR